MFKFGGWKASLSFSGPRRRKEVYENGPALSVGGAYRAHREESFGRNSISEPPKKLTPSMVKLPPSIESLKTSKSAVELADPHNLPPQLRKSANDVSTDPRGGTSSNRNSSALHKNKHKTTKEDKKQDKEQKSADKKRIAEQKKQKQIAMQEQAKQDKLRIKQEKKTAAQHAKDVKSRKEKGSKNKAPQGPLPQASVAKTQVPQAPIPPPQPAQRANPMAYSTNTLESSISRTSGPPPYTETKPPEKQPNKKDNTGNTSFSKPIERSSWDMISEHRSQMNRNPVASGSSKQVVMDLQFRNDKAQTSDRNNSEV